MSVLATFVKKSHLEARDLLLCAFHPKRATDLADHKVVKGSMFIMWLASTMYVIYLVVVLSNISEILPILIPLLPYHSFFLNTYTGLLQAT